MSVVVEEGKDDYTYVVRVGGYFSNRYTHRHRQGCVLFILPLVPPNVNYLVAFLTGTETFVHTVCD